MGLPPTNEPYSTGLEIQKQRDNSKLECIHPSGFIPFLSPTHLHTG